MRSKESKGDNTCMLSWIFGVTIKDKTRDEYMRESLKVSRIEEKMRACHLMWFGHT